jgi:tetratricopeptide (TPR) repeat protein
MHSTMALSQKLFGILIAGVTLLLAPAEEQGSLEELLREGVQALADRDFETASRFCQDAIGRAEREKDALALSNSLRCLSIAYTEKGRLPEAESLAVREVELREGSPSRDLYRAVCRLADLRETRGDADGALEAWRRALSVGEALVKDDAMVETDLLTPLERVGRAAHREGNEIDAGKLIDRYESAFRANFGSGVLAAQNPWLAEYYRETSRPDAAEVLYKASISHFETRLNRLAYSGALAAALTRYADFLDEMGRVREAERARERAAALHAPKE